MDYSCYYILLTAFIPIGIALYDKGSMKTTQ